MFSDYEGTESKVFNEIYTDTAKITASIEANIAAYDHEMKKLLACKPILACIFKETVQECADMTYAEIEQCIEGEPQVCEVPLSPDLEIIEGLPQEDSKNKEGTVRYDIRTYLKIPGNDLATIKIFVNVEAQQDDKPGYDISERGIFYACRMISSQLGSEFTNKDSDPKKYSNIKKVYSIWICNNTAECRANSVDRYYLQRDTIIGENNDSPRYDLLEVLVVNIGHSRMNSLFIDSNMLEMLNGLLDRKAKVPDRLQTLENCGIAVTKEVEKEVMNMNHPVIEAYEEAANEIILRMLKNGMTKDQILNAVSEEEYERALKLFKEGK